MATTRDIRRRIKSVKSTAQITKAMQLVAASKMKKAQDQALSGRPYAELMNKVLVNLQEYSQDESHPLLDDRGEGKELVILVTSDKGLCGALNTNLIKQAFKTHGGASFVTIGTKGRRAVSRLKKDLLADFHITDPVEFPSVKTISKYVRDRFLEGDYARVYVAFTNFVNTLTQLPHIETLLPVSPVTLGRRRDYEENLEAGRTSGAGDVPEAGYTFEPDPRVILDAIVPQYVDYQIYQMVLEARASEHSARMVAMKNATDNAKQIIKDLTLEYNKVRQAAITSELLEITTASLALE